MNSKAAMLILVVSLLFLPFIVTIQAVNADVYTSSYIAYGSGVCLYSPLNKTYTSNPLLLNLTFGKGIGLDCQLGYSIDGQSYGEIPMNSPPTKEYRTIIQMEVPPLQLPTLKDGPHNLTINVNASTEGYTHSWVHTICFTVDSSSSPTLTPVTVTMPSPTPMEITAANPSQTVLSPTSDQQPPTPLAAIIILVAAAVYITAVIVLATLKGKR